MQRRCERCREWIRADARTCPHCHSQHSVGTVEFGAAQAQIRMLAYAAILLLFAALLLAALFAAD